MAKYSNAITTPIKTNRRKHELLSGLSITEASAQAFSEECERYRSTVSAKMESLCDHYEIVREVGVDWTTCACRLAIALAEDHIPGFGEVSEKNRPGRKRIFDSCLEIEVEALKSARQSAGLNCSDKQALEIIKKDVKMWSIRTFENRLSRARAARKKAQAYWTELAAKD